MDGGGVLAVFTVDVGEPPVFEKAQGFLGGLRLNATLRRDGRLLGQGVVELQVCVELCVVGLGHQPFLGSEMEPGVFHEDSQPTADNGSSSADFADLHRF